jgi:serine/threonine protein kinase
MFFGREDVFDFIRRNLVGRHSNNPIVLYGQRRSGKTSVLYQLQRHLGSGYWCIFIDLHGLDLRGMGNLLHGIAAAVSTHLRRDHQITIEVPNRAAFQNEAISAFETLFIDQVLKVIGESQLVLMLDEAVRLDEEVRAGRLEHEIFEYLRHLMQHSQRLNFIFSLGTGIEEMDKDYSLLFSGSLYHRISFLTPQAARDLILRPAQDHYQVTERGVDRILQITSGHPYFTQLICHCLFNAWQQKAGSTVGTDVIAGLLAEAIELGSANLTYIWQDSTAEEQALMAGLAAAASSGRTTATAEEIRDAWRQVDVDLPSQIITRALRGLLAREVISGDGSYSFAVDLQRLWIDKHRRIDWVKDDLSEASAQWAVPGPSVPDDQFDPHQTNPEQDTELLFRPHMDTQVILGFPPELRDRYTVLSEFPNPGAGADVVLAQDNAAPNDAPPKVVKVYRRGIHADPAVWAKLRELNSDNIVRYTETGTSGGRDYEVMEYVPGGNLAKSAVEGKPMPLDKVIRVVGQVSAALAELHRHGIVHRNLKPENILVRRADPFDVVVTDFSLAQVPEQSVVAASRAGTLAYLAPETLLATPAQFPMTRDWWALGMLVRDLLTGNRAFTGMTAAGIVRSVGPRPVDLGAVTDPRAHLLCRGLLLRDPAKRWGAEQVSEWLAGGSPAVTDERIVETARIKPITFQAVTYQDRRTLALALAQSWDQAVTRYFKPSSTVMGEPSAWRELQAWLEQSGDPDDTDITELHALMDGQLSSRSVAPDVKLLLLIQWLDPEMPPVYRARTMDGDSLAALAEHIAVTPEPEPDLSRLITDLRRHALLPTLARMPGGGGLAELAARWQQLNDQFRQVTLTAELALPPNARQKVMDEDNPRRLAALLYVALDPQLHAARLEEHSASLPDLLPVPVQWFDHVRAETLSRPHPLNAPLLLTLFPQAASDSAAADLARQQHEEAAQRGKVIWADREQKRKAHSPDMPQVLKNTWLQIISIAVMLVAAISFFVAEKQTGNTGNSNSVSSATPEIVAAIIAAVIAAVLVIASELSLANQLGGDYAQFPRFTTDRFRERGLGCGCLTLTGIALFIGISISAPEFVYIVLAFLQLLSWRRRRAAWKQWHEQERRQFLGNAA